MNMNAITTTSLEVALKAARVAIAHSSTPGGFFSLTARTIKTLADAAESGKSAKVERDELADIARNTANAIKLYASGEISRDALVFFADGSLTSLASLGEKQSTTEKG